MDSDPELPGGAGDRNEDVSGQRRPCHSEGAGRDGRKRDRAEAEVDCAPTSGSAAAGTNGQHWWRGKSSAPSAAPPVARGRPAPREGREGWTDLGHGSWVGYWKCCFPLEADIFARLQGEVKWLQRDVTVRGRKIPQPRLTAYMADAPGLAYTYSGLRLEPVAFTPTVLEVKAEAEARSGAAFNCCLLNCYRDGGDRMGWHSDNESLFGERPTIASVSFGCRRDFLLRRNEDVSEKHRFGLGEGDVLVMAGATQEDWQHSVPRRARVGACRINLTFRRIVSPERGGGAEFAGTGKGIGFRESRGGE
eukprot:evm.model.scf_254EXC.15 EVM.evm.TU.scf_254EXC.15   scf_254EXC:107867-108891(+)